MSPKAQRTAIAEIMKWAIDEEDVACWEPLTDLNAMQEAEKTLTDEQHQAFRNELAGICGFNYRRVEKSDPQHHRNYVSASAGQRAEAFLKAVGKWEETR